MQLFLLLCNQTKGPIGINFTNLFSKHFVFAKLDSNHFTGLREEAGQTKYKSDHNTSGKLKIYSVLKVFGYKYLPLLYINGAFSSRKVLSIPRSLNSFLAHFSNDILVTLSTTALTTVHPCVV